MEHDCLQYVGLVRHFLATRFRSHTRQLGREDAFQVAFIGLLKALKKYDPSRGPIQPLIAIWIRGELNTALRLVPVVSVPMNKWKNGVSVEIGSIDSDIAEEIEDCDTDSISSLRYSLNCLRNEIRKERRSAWCRRYDRMKRERRLGVK